jgi:hypothetical protein
MFGFNVKTVFTAALGLGLMGTPRFTIYTPLELSY